MDFCPAGFERIFRAVVVRADFPQEDSLPTFLERLCGRVGAVACLGFELLLAAAFWYFLGGLPQVWAFEPALRFALDVWGALQGRP